MTILGGPRIYSECIKIRGPNTPSEGRRENTWFICLTIMAYTTTYRLNVS